MSHASAPRTGVLLTAYGTPESLDQVAAYFTHIRGGRAPSPDAIARLTHRYARVGGRTPLLAITHAVARALERELAVAGTAQRVYVGMKHWHPFIAETMRTIVEEGIERLIVVPLAPHYSRISIGGYRKAVDDACAVLSAPADVVFVERWHGQPEFRALIAALVRDGLARWSDTDRADVQVVFSAHSLPERIRGWDDPYERELLESSAAVAERAGIRRWCFAWQSAGDTGEPWLGPDILDRLETLHAEGVRHVLQVPIGFVSDHLEILWDIDVEARQKAATLGMVLHRTELPNVRPDFIRTLAAVVRDAVRGSASGTHSAQGTTAVETAVP